MAWGVRWYLVGAVMLAVVGVLAGCGGGYMFAERETWRRDAEVECINSGTVKESAGVVRVTAIRGPGTCGAEFPLKVSALGGSGVLGYSDDLRPPGAIPGGASQPRWPGASPRNEPPAYEPQPIPYPSRPAPAARGPSRYQSSSGEADGPISLSPPGVRDAPAPAPEPYDYRKPYGGAPKSTPPRAPVHSDANPPHYDLSPVPYDKRRVIDAARSEQPTATARGSVRADPLPPAGVSAGVSTVPTREAPPPALGPARGAPITASIGPVAMNPPATLACPIVSALDQWLANDVQPSAMRWFGSPVAEIKQISAYSCRGMNGNPRANISEHSFGNALDIASFTLADGRKITVKNGWHGSPEEQGFLRDVQGAACEQFNTVLAPGSNIYHYDHIHVDLMRRRSGRRACNPDAVPGEVVAARAGARYAGRRPGDSAVTGAVSARRTGSAPRFGSDSDEGTRRNRALPMAEPGNDGQDDD
jgi:hypothetical protein